MDKTVQMLLIEARAGKDIRDVLREAYDEAGNVTDAAAIVTERYGQYIAFGTFHDWVRQTGGRIAKTLIFEGYANEPAEVPA